MGGQRRLQLLVWGVVALGCATASWVLVHDYLDPGGPIEAARAPGDDARSPLDLPRATAVPTNATTPPPRPS